MTSVLYSTIGSLRQGVFDMQAIENDALKPGPTPGPPLVHLWSTSGPLFKSPSNPHKYWVNPILVRLVRFLSPIYIYYITYKQKKSFI